MGTPVVVIWATIYFWWHEKHVLIPRYGSMIPLLLRFIDDMFGIVLVGDPPKWKMFEQDLNSFGILKWELEDPCQCLDYLGVTLTLKDGIISSKSYQKPTSLCQYVYLISAHPPWVTRGVVFSMLKRYHLQNTFVNDFCEVVMLFYKRLRDRGLEKCLDTHGYRSPPKNHMP